MTENTTDPGTVSLQDLPFFTEATSAHAQADAGHQEVLSEQGGRPRHPRATAVPPGAASHLSQRLGPSLQGDRGAETAPGEQPVSSRPAGIQPQAGAPAQAQAQVQVQVRDSFAQRGDVEPSRGQEEAFWRTVAVLRSRAADRQAEETQQRQGVSETEREQIGRRHIAEVVEEWVREQLQTTGRDGRWSAWQQERARKAVFDQMFRLGRFQGLIDEPEVENVHINGHDDVWVELSGGMMERRAPVAESDEQLMADLQFLASRNGEEARPFTSAHPDLDMDLLGSVRLAALAPPIVPRPSAVFRIHRYVNISLEQMVSMGVLTAQMAEFLTACVVANKSVVISGFGGDGKTTFMRALADKIGLYEQIVTIEKERELHLEQLTHRPLRPFPLQYRPGAGERLADGTQAGEYTLEKALEKALRLNSQRILVGEVRGPEITAMLQAMQTGAGTFCTTHAYDPDDCLDRLAGLGMSRYGEAYMARQLGHHLDLVVQIAKVAQPDGRRVRKITWISEVLPAEGARKVTTQPLFQLSAGQSHAQVVTAPSNPRFRRDLELAGYDLSRMGGVRS